MKTRADQPQGSGPQPGAADLEDLKRDFTQLRADVVNLFTHAFGVGKSGADALEHRAADAMEHLKHRMAELRERSQSKIEEHPISSALIAFGAGLVAGTLFRRRN
jgi:ElaB/YqjD/DUF883 family membrane-anchored ribosome-binding protein